MQDICFIDTKSKKPNAKHSDLLSQSPECGFSEKVKSKSPERFRIQDFCLWATKKIFSAVLRMNSNSYQKNLELSNLVGGEPPSVDQ